MFYCLTTVRDSATVHGATTASAGYTGYLRPTGYGYGYGLMLMHAVYLLRWGCENLAFAFQDGFFG